MERINHETAVDIGGGKKGFRGRDTMGGATGTRVTPKWLNDFQEELCGVVEYLDTLDGSKRDQLLRVIRTLVQQQKDNYKAAAGSANVLTLTPDLPLTSYFDGLTLRFQVLSSNTTGATLNVSGLGAKTILRQSGEALQANDLKGGAVVEVIYSGGSFYLNGSSSFPIQSGSSNYAATAGTANALTVTLSPVPTSLTTGMVIRVKPSFSNTGAATINVNALGAKSIVRPDGTSLQANDLVANRVVELVYDGANFELLTLSPYAIQSGSAIYADDTGAANAISIVLTPTPTSYLKGMAVRFLVAAPNTGSVTINVNGLGAKSLTYSDGSDLQAGDLQLGNLIEASYDGAKFQLINITFRALRALASQVGRTQIFFSSGTFTVPAGVTSAEVEVFGAGGPGGTSGDGVGNPAGTPGAGGGGGAYTRKRVTNLTPGAAIPVTVGLGGVGVANAASAGTAGGTSSFGSYCSATGGTGGLSGRNYLSTGGTGGVATGGDINIPGAAGGTGGPQSTWDINYLLHVFNKGGLAGLPFGNVSAFGTGANGAGYGTGGNGASGGSALAGGNGAPGLVIVRW
ncbi:hypothetical protein [Microvirga terricola]|uniref:Glycine-rich domain-containing protein n=1 Tax=Microvirga terricola TaxID=2719797 RepID=A0ABX0V6C1_9HYPH|nr:hypothetical protein [Microvirga terricola]NIX75377.1 hypothetical protein [Microvirga terricola]